MNPKPDNWKVREWKNTNISVSTVTENALTPPV